MQKKIISFIAIFSFVILNTLICFNIYKTKFISKDIVRLHVIANSNNISDQITKLRVESKIKDFLNNLKCENKNDYLNAIKENSNEILQIANTITSQNGNTYSSTLEVGKIAYDKKQSINLDMSKGTYDSACIILGNGDGKNIWSIIFPNENTIKKIEELDTIMPGLSTIYNDEEKEDDIKISSKILEYFNIDINNLI